MSSSKITWQAYDRIEQSHGPDWYWAVGIIALSLAVTAVLLNNMLFAILVVLSTVVLFLRTLQKPRLMDYELTNRGLWVNKEFHPFSSFESFWVEDEPILMLLLKSKSMLTPFFSISLKQTDTEGVREFLQEFLPEVEQHEPLAKKIMEFLGF